MRLLFPCGATYFRRFRTTNRGLFSFAKKKKKGPNDERSEGKLEALSERAKTQNRRFSKRYNFYDESVAKVQLARYCWALKKIRGRFENQM